MAKRYTMQGQARQAKASAALRAGNVPGVLYGHGIPAKSIQVNALQFNRIFQQAGSTSLVALTLDDNSEHAVLIREAQYHPLKDTIIHSDFYQVRMDEEIRTQVPLSFAGESPAVKDKGGVLLRNLDEIAIEALPADLPHDIEVDISVLDDFEKVIHVKDIPLPKGVQVLHEPDEVVALVQPPRTEAEMEELTAEVKEDVEGVEGVKPEVAPAEGAEGEAAPEGKPEEKKE